MKKFNVLYHLTEGHPIRLLRVLVHEVVVAATKDINSNAKINFFILICFD